MKKILSTLAAFILFSLALQAESLYEQFGKMKVKLYSLPNEERLNEMEDFESALTKDEDMAEEERLYMSSFLVLEKVNAMESEKEKYLLLENQNAKNSLYMKDKKLSELSALFLLAVADIKSRRLSYISGQEVMKEAGLVKELYLQAIKKDKKFSPARLSYALYLYFAPPVSGGGIDNSLKEFSRAVACASTLSEKYFSLCYRAQVYFKTGQRKKGEKDLESAHALFGEECFTDVIKDFSSNGKVFFE